MFNCYGDTKICSVNPHCEAAIGTRILQVVALGIKNCRACSGNTVCRGFHLHAYFNHDFLIINPWLYNAVKIMILYFVLKIIISSLESSFCSLLKHVNDYFVTVIINFQGEKIQVENLVFNNLLRYYLLYYFLG